MAPSAEGDRVRLAELVAALSLGIDLGFGQPMEHVLRQCLIALRLAERIGLDDDERANVYYTALLINVGYRLAARWDQPGGALRPALFQGTTAGQVVVAGYSYWGRGICQMLTEAQVPYLAFDIDLERLRVGESSRHNVHYGDVTDPTMMGAVAIAHARAVVVTTSSFDDSRRMIDNLRQFYPAVPVLTAVQLLTQRDELRRMGHTPRVVR